MLGEAVVVPRRRRPQRRVRPQQPRPELPALARPRFIAIAITCFLYNYCYHYYMAGVGRGAAPRTTCARALAISCDYSRPFFQYYCCYYHHAVDHELLKLTVTIALETNSIVQHREHFAAITATVTDVKTIISAVAVPVPVAASRILRAA